MADGKGPAGRALDAARRAADGYKANREALEPLIRLTIDALALAALMLRRRPAPAAIEREGGEQS